MRTLGRAVAHVACLERKGRGVPEIGRVLAGAEIRNDGLRCVEGTELAKEAVNVAAGSCRVIGLAGGELLGVDADARSGVGGGTGAVYQLARGRP
jgi:hypothetical protein